jgi:uncharacterized membrane protein
MTASPPPTLYHRWMGWHAPAMRRAAVVVVIGLVVAVLLLGFLPWGLAVVGGWDAAALAFLMIVWPIILRADSPHAELAGRESGAQRVLLIGVAVLTVVLSWTVVNTIYTLRYADLHFGSRAAGIGFGDSVGQERPNYRDFAYVAFTIGMTYQVSDTTVRDPRIRRTVLSHAVLSYVFGVVIVGGAVNLVAGLVR